MSPRDFVISNYERNEGDRYWTEPAVTAALARRLPQGIKRVWEPAAGRGDMAEVLIDFGYEVIASDIDVNEFDPGICPVHEYNFLTERWPDAGGIDAIITNPPFGKEAEQFVRKSLSYTDVRYHAFLLRTVWKAASGRTDIFVEQPFACEIVLTWRPRWDWWFRDKPEKSPMHNYSWFCFDREHVGPSTTYWAGRDS